ncbi:MFS transporter [Nocardia rhamnosiphila]|uniref:MFS transporter n=1 Tax=Nocardia rhamnosiphila TaxID=426716 RepID=A0ABV2WYM3_9NOCA
MREIDEHEPTSNAHFGSSLSADDETTGPPRPGLRQRLLVSTLILVTALASLIGTLGAPLIVAVTREYHVTPATAQWTISLPCLVGAACMPLVSWLASSRYRRRTTLVILALMSMGSLIAALPVSFGALLIGRSLHGLGLGLLPIAVAAAREALSGQHRDRAIAAVSVANVLGAGVAFAVIGVLLDVGGTHLAYLAAGVTTALILTLAAWVIPAHEAGSPAPRPVDIFGSILLAAGGTALVFALARGEATGWLSPATALAAVASIALIGGWIRQSGRSAHPLIDLRRAHAPLPLSVFVTSFTGGAGMLMMLTLVMVIAQSPTSTGWGVGMSGSTAGLAMLPYAVGTVVGSRLSAGIRRRLRPTMWLPLGCVVYSAAAAVLLVGHRNAVQLLVAMAVAGVAGGLSFAHIPGLLVLSVPIEETGAAVGFSMVIRLLGFSVGSTLAGVLLSEVAKSGAAESGVELALAVHLGWWLFAVLAALLAGRRGAVDDRGVSGGA